MSHNVGNALQTILNNNPEVVATNDNISVVLTKGGDLHQTGLIGKRIRESFDKIHLPSNVIGKIIDVVATENLIFFLTDAGYVYLYDYQHQSKCHSGIELVYQPINFKPSCGPCETLDNRCEKDPAIKIKAGKNHLVILTLSSKLYGYGDNSEYQLVPQGECYYNFPVQMVIYDTNTVDGTCSDDYIFRGKLAVPPTLNPRGEVCASSACESGQLGPINIQRFSTTTNPPTIFTYLEILGQYDPDNYDDKKGNAVPAILLLPLTVSFDYNIFLNGCKGLFGGQVMINNITIGYDLPNAVIVDATSRAILVPLGKVLQINNLFVHVNPTFQIISVNNLFQSDGHIFVTQLSLTFQFYFTFTASFYPILPGPTDLQVGIDTTRGAVFVPASIQGNQTETFVATIDLNPIRIDLNKCSAVEPDYCIKDIYAGENQTVILDDRNRLTVLGSLYEIRDNKDLFKNKCLDKLLNGIATSIKLPAEQLNCQQGNCSKVDLCDVKVELAFAAKNSSTILPESNKNACEFLEQLQECNNQAQCNDTCQPCGNTIFMDLVYLKKITPATPNLIPTFSSVYIFNRLSVDHILGAMHQEPGISTIPFDDFFHLLQSGPRPDLLNTVEIDLDTSRIDFNQGKFLVDCNPFSVDKVLQLTIPPNAYPNIRIGSETIFMYVDIDKNDVFGEKSIQLTRDTAAFYNIVFDVNTLSFATVPTPSGVYPMNTFAALNYGGIMNPVALKNFQASLNNYSYRNNPMYRTPVLNKIYNTYLRPADYVKFNFDINFTQLMVTADVPTVFCLNKKIIDVSLGDNNITVLTKSVNCPNEICVLGNNCRGQLGLGNASGIIRSGHSPDAGNCYNTLCWKKVNNCCFKGEITGIDATCDATFYFSSCGRIYWAGEWNCVQRSSQSPGDCLTTNCSAPQIFEPLDNYHSRLAAFANRHIMFISEKDNVYGVGENELGELGLCVKCVKCPEVIRYFNLLNKCVIDDVEHVIREIKSSSHESRESNRSPKKECSSPKKECCVKTSSKSKCSNNCGCGKKSSPKKSSPKKSICCVQRSSQNPMGCEKKPQKVCRPKRSSHYTAKSYREDLTRVIAKKGLLY